MEAASQQCSLERFSVPLTLGRGQTGSLPLNYNPTLGRIIKQHVCDSYLFIKRLFWSEPQLSSWCSCVSWAGITQSSVIFLLHFTAIGSFAGLLRVSQPGYGMGQADGHLLALGSTLLTHVGSTSLKSQMLWEAQVLLEAASGCPSEKDSEHP